MLWRTYTIFVLVPVLSLAGCNESPLEPTTLTLEIEVVSAPDPVRAVASTGVTYELDGLTLEYEFMVTFDLIFRLADDQVGVTIGPATLAFEQATGGIVIEPSRGEIAQFRWDSREVGDRIEPGGETTIAFNVWYTAPHGGGGALITVSWNVQNDNNFGLFLSHEVMVAE